MNARQIAALVSIASGLAAAQSAPQIKALQLKVDSLSEELRLLERVLSSKGVDIEREKRQLALQDSVFQIPVDPAATLGDPKAPVTLVLFTDLQCPYCARMAPVLQNLREQHPKSLRIGFRHFPLVSIHDKSMSGHLALWAAQRQNHLWDYYFKLAPNFRALSDEALSSTARELGLDMQKFDADRHSEEARQAVEADMKFGESVGVNGTPSLYLDGRAIHGPEEVAKACAKYEPAAPKK
jgi:protein-disulfide isomerase